VWEKEWNALRGMCFHSYKGLHNLDCVVCSPDVEKPGPHVFKMKPSGKLEDLKNLMKVTQDEFDSGIKYNEQKKSASAFMNSSEKWLAAYYILESEDVKAANLRDPRSCEDALESMVARLPLKNTYKGLLLLRHAWTLVDVFHSKADYYKKLAKWMYAVYLLLTTAMAAIFILSNMYAAVASDSMWPNLLLILSLLACFVQGWMTYSKPASKWVLLRSSAISLESEIWKFRSRTDEYAGAASAMYVMGRDNAEKVAEQRFQAVLKTIKDNVFETVKLTSIFSTAIISDGSSPPGSSSCWHRPRGRGRLQHMQYETGDSQPAENQDDHHRPVTPDCFIKLRLDAAMKFYQCRIPLYSRINNRRQALTLIAATMPILLSATDQLQWAAIFAALSGALSTWVEFSSLSKKLMRYSSVVMSLSHLLVWWRSLSKPEQRQVDNIDRLVRTTEAIIGDENSAWVSDVHKTATKMIMQMAGAEKSHVENKMH